MLLLFICTAAYCHQLFPAFMDRKKDSYVPNMIQYYRKRDLIHGRPVVGVAWKCARIGERLSPYISVCCVIFAVRKTTILSRTYLTDTGSFVHRRIREGITQIGVLGVKAGWSLKGHVRELYGCIKSISVMILERRPKTTALPKYYAIRSIQPRSTPSPANAVAMRKATRFLIREDLS